MGLFQQRLAERRRQQHGAATLESIIFSSSQIEANQSEIAQRVIPKPKPNRDDVPRSRGQRGPSLTTYVLYCDVCGGRFEAKQPGAKHCSKSCDNKAYKARRKAREEANPPTPKAPTDYTSPSIEAERAANAARKAAKGGDAISE